MTIDDLFEGADGIDEITRELIVDFYRTRYVFDNTKFLRFFNIRSRMLSRQYAQYLRLETCEFDPMVTKYLERQVIDKRTTTTSETTVAQNDVNKSGGNTVTLGGADTTTLERNTTETVTLDGGGTTTVTATGDNTVTHSGEDTVSTDETTDNARKVTYEAGTKIDVSDVSNVTTDDLDNVSSTNKQLVGSTPDTSLYPVGGMPENLSWQYASNQQEATGSSNSVKHGSEKSDGTTITTNSGTDVTDDTVNETKSVDSSTSYGHKIVDAQNTTTKTNVDLDQTSTDKITGTDTSSTQFGKTTTTDLDETTTTKQNGTKNGTDEVEGKIQEIYTGRDGSPQDLLDTARNYILQTNSLQWIIAKYEDCFSQFYDGEENYIWN